MTAVAVHHLHKSYNGKPAVNDLSLSVEPGEILGLIGPNGAGKSSTIKMILDFMRPDSGEIAIFGRPMSEATKDRIGYLPEEKGLYKKLRAIDQIISSSEPATEVAQVASSVPSAQPSQGPGDPNLANIAVPGVFSLLLGLALMFGATSLISGLAEEKESRLIQVLFSSVSIRQLLVGKVLALGTAGLLQVLVWLISTPLLLGLASSQFGGFMSRIQVPVNFLVLGLTYFILGYLLFAVLSIGIGAISSSPREGTNLFLIYTLGSFVPLWLSSLNMFFPNMAIWVLLTIFPVTAPVMTMLRLGTSGVPLWQILASIGVLSLSIVVGLILSITIFRMHMLIYGKRPSIAQLAKSLREA